MDALQVMEAEAIKADSAVKEATTITPKSMQDHMDMIKMATGGQAPNWEQSTAQTGQTAMGSGTAADPYTFNPGTVIRVKKEGAQEGDAPAYEGTIGDLLKGAGNAITANSPLPEQPSPQLLAPSSDRGRVHPDNPITNTDTTITPNPVYKDTGQY
jgi:hypothetical protein